MHAGARGGPHAAEVAVRVGEPLQADGELHIARAHNVLDFEILRGNIVSISQREDVNPESWCFKSVHRSLPPFLLALTYRFRASMSNRWFNCSPVFPENV